MIKTIAGKKSLGQNFLTNKNKIGEVISALELKDRDVVLEIGPGHGELKKELITINQKLRIIAIEKDEKLAEELRNSMEIYGDKIEIITGDILKILPGLVSDHKLNVGGYKLIGNIPYYITGFLLRVIGELKNKPSVIALTVQKEVAERICGGMNPIRSGLLRMNPPHKSMWGMNLLAASIQFWAKPEIVGFIPKRDFSPEPKVDSAIIRLITYNLKPETNETKNYYKFIKILFKQPRKTVANNISGLFGNKKEADAFLEKNAIAPSSRPQNLSLESIREVAKMVYNKKQ